MKRTIISLYLYLILNITLVAQPAAFFDYTSFDFGTILWKNPVTATFEIKNQGNSPLTITHVEASCGCTEVQWSETPIPNGKTGKIIATFDAQQLGSFHKFLDVYTNVEEEPYYLTISGKVATELDNYENVYPFQIGNIRLDKNNIEFKHVEQGEKAIAEINLLNTGEEDYRPTLMHLPSYIKAEATPTILKKRERGKIILTLNTEQLQHLGLTQSKIFLARHMGDKVGSENELNLSAVMLPNFSKMTSAQKLLAPKIIVSKTELDFGKLGTKKKLSQTITLTNNGKSTLKIMELQVFDPALNVSLRKRTIAPNETVKLKISIVASYLKNAKEPLKALLITNDPQNPQIIIHANYEM